jgi:hypothetical protein
MLEHLSRAVPATDDPIAWINRIAYIQFMHWWASCLPGHAAGDAVSRMWKTYPQGAILPDSDWCWWSLERVARDGFALAEQLGGRGLVIAEGRQGAAVLHWPSGKGSLPQLLLVPFAAGASDRPVSVDPQRFIEAQGFHIDENVIACALAPKNAAFAPVVEPVASAVPCAAKPVQKSPCSDRRESRPIALGFVSSQQVCASVPSRREAPRVLKKSAPAASFPS